MTKLALQRTSGTRSAALSGGAASLRAARSVS
jgi:hypothetical protein